MPSLRNSVATEFPNPVAPQNLVKILSIGIDADDDKVIDRVEDAGPNGGGWQQRWYRRQCPGPCCISSHIRNSYITVEANPMQVLRVLGFDEGTQSFDEGTDYLAQADPLSSLNGLNFVYGFLSFDVLDVVAGEMQILK